MFPLCGRSVLSVAYAIESRLFPPASEILKLRRSVKLLHKQYWDFYYDEALDLNHIICHYNECQDLLIKPFYKCGAFKVQDTHILLGSVGWCSTASRIRLNTIEYLSQKDQQESEIGLKKDLAEAVQQQTPYRKELPTVYLCDHTMSCYRGSTVMHSGVRAIVSSSVATFYLYNAIIIVDQSIKKCHTALHANNSDEYFIHVIKSLSISNLMETIMSIGLVT
uniref:AlNc14C184G8290 protein n=1 Tax=Albugo laibachii Nc14 TaxID=890382 RepID=F0WPE5_9STRA|nr:AlNc14C184G8290 [Albugo laibachii Nc14]|eukprot:CCA23192.1 AlNc14C184G8290 [Albugo laibachii Nc14]